jgi:transcription factor E2F3
LFCSQFEEKFEDMNSVEPPVSFPVASSSGSNENPPTEVVNVNITRNEIEPQALYGHQISSDLSASQDFAGGMMKIVPSDVDVSFVILSNLFL